MVNEGYISVWFNNFFSDLQEKKIEELIFLWYVSGQNSILQRKIEPLLNKFISNNLLFSRETFFEICIVKRIPVTLHFIPTSNAFKIYGAHLTLYTIIGDEEFFEIEGNYLSKPRKKTSGIIYGDIYPSEKEFYTPEQIASVNYDGFDTKHVWKIFYG